MYEAIPADLKRLKQWVCWIATPDQDRPGKIKKVPINAKTGDPAQSNNPDTWCDYDTAVKQATKYSGIGFMFANGYFGVDIDNIDDDIDNYKNGNIDNIVGEFIHTLQTYAEYSVSGRGLHLICQGELPPAGRRSGNVEMYQDGRYFIMTGNKASEYTAIKNCTDTIKALHEKYISGGSEPTTGIVVTENLNMTENDIIELINKSKQKETFNNLYHGQWEQYYTSQSEADLALCNMLAFWTGRNAQLMDGLFRKSSLMREKWDKKHGKDTYGHMTIGKAIRDTSVVYTPKPEYKITIENPIEPGKLYTFDDTGNAERLFDTFGAKIRYSYVNKMWLYYDGRKWCDDYKGVIKKLSDEVVEHMKHERNNYIKNMADDSAEDEIEKQFQKHLKASRSSKGKTAMIKETEHRVPILPDEIDRHSYLLNTPNGIINLKDGKVTAHDPAKNMTKITYAEITDKSTCELWDKFLLEITNNDRELIRFIQKAVGYSLSGSTQEQCIFFCYGQGRNGKSTFLDIISDMLGDYAMNIQPETIMIRNNSGGANSDVARLKGARFVTSVEPNEGVRLNEGLIKQLTGGDKVTARRQYGNEFEFTPEFKIWMATNHKPTIRGTDMGIWRRVHLIPFTVQIPDGKIDKHLKYKLKQELPAIMKWAVDGCLLWQKEGLTPPAAVREATNEYKSEMDVIGSFIEECCASSNGQVKASDLFQAYTKWAENNNEYKMSNTKFGKEISKRFEKTKSYGIYYKGLTINPEYMPYKLQFGG